VTFQTAKRAKRSKASNINKNSGVLCLHLPRQIATNLPSIAMRDEGASRTALVIAVALIILGGDSYGSKLCPPNAVDLQKLVLRESGLVPKWLPFWVISNALYSKLMRWSLSLVVYPGTLEIVGARKTFMEDQTRAKLNVSRNCRQVLILAAGYDTLALRLAPEYPDVGFWEVDHPGTARRKQVAVEAIGQSPNFHMLAADLTETSLQSVLQSCDAYDTSASTVVVMEGLLMYLSEQEVRKLFQDVANVVGSNKQQNDSIVCFDYFGWNEETNMADVGWLAPLCHRIVEKQGEPWKWGVAPEKLSTFFEKNNDSSWKVSMQLSHSFENFAVVER
jgi:methyltransferase (TIGR00027 family)